MKATRTWKMLSTKIIHETKWLKLREDKVIQPNGKEGVYTFLDRADGVAILAYDGTHLLFVEEYRYPIGKTLTQLPLGGTDYNEDYLFVAKKELREECGIEAKKWTFLGDQFPTPGFEKSTTHIFVAEELDKDIKTDFQEEDEAIDRVVKYTLEEAKNLICEGKIQCGVTISALFQFEIYLEKSNIK